MCVYVCELNTTTAWNYFNYPLCENAISRVDCNRMKMGKTIIQHRNIHLLLFTRHRNFEKLWILVKGNLRCLTRFV